VKLPPRPTQRIDRIHLGGKAEGIAELFLGFFNDGGSIETKSVDVREFQKSFLDYSIYSFGYALTSHFILSIGFP
jgi:hypothetical protein